MAEPGEVCVYQFKVVLRGVSPMIWRRILLRSDQTIADLHYTIQIVMGWSDSHLNRFHIHGKDYGGAHEGGIWFDDNPEKVHLAGFGFRLRERFLYESDFSDLWEHGVRLENGSPVERSAVSGVHRRPSAGSTGGLRRGGSLYGTRRSAVARVVRRLASRRLGADG